MYCRKCGKTIPDDSNYCNYCGGEVVTEAPTNKNRLLIPLLIVVIIFLLFIFLFSSRYLIRTLFPAPLDYEKLSQSVVKICCYDSLGRDNGTGSGVIVLSDNVIATNHHVICGESPTLEIITDQGDRIGVKSVIAYDEAKDLALLELERAPGFPPLPIGNSTNLKRGNKVSTISSPLGILNAASEGVISGFEKPNQDVGDVIQFTAPISDGSSGGALLNEQGELIGIIMAIKVGGQNLNYAIPAYEIEQVLTYGRTDLSFSDFYNLSEHENLVKTVQEIIENRTTLTGRTFAVNGEITEINGTEAYIIDPDTADRNTRILVDFKHTEAPTTLETGTEIYMIGLFVNASSGPVFYPNTIEIK